MSSPFPGMDPFLEHPDIFPDLHDRLNTQLSEDLQAGLPSPYYAVIGRRTWIEVPRDERREPLLEVYVRQGSDKRLVTSIEILSLTNKTPGEHGRELYLRKQREILGSKVHLVEIDLLRGGEHSTAVPCELVQAEVGPFDYHMCVHHFDNLEDYFIYPIQLDERLPQIAIPLLPGDPAVTIDLQALFDHCYDAGPYAREVSYEADAPVPPLRPDRVAWAKGILQHAAGRKARPKDDLGRRQKGQTARFQYEPPSLFPALGDSPERSEVNHEPDCADHSRPRCYRPSWQVSRSVRQSFHRRPVERDANHRTTGQQRAATNSMIVCARHSHHRDERPDPCTDGRQTLPSRKKTNSLDMP